MAGKETKLTIVVDAQNKANAGLASVNSSLKSMGGSLESVAGTMRTIGTVGAVGFAAVSAEIYASVRAASDAEAIQSQLGAVLKSTGQAAGVTADMANALSKSLERSTAFSDEQVLSAENMALTFTAIHKDIFPQVTEAALDMATAMNHGITPSGEEATEMMKLLGKALQDPDAGLGALHRVGVNVDELTEKFKGVNDVGEKQRLILQELATEYGGSAQAAMGTTAGQAKHLREELDDLQETIGQRMLPIIRAVIAIVEPIVAKLAEWTEAHPKLAAAVIGITLVLTGLMAVLLPISLALPGLAVMFGALGAAMAAVSLPMLVVVAGAAAVAVALEVLIAKGYTTREAWQQVWTGIKVIAAEAVNGVIGVVESMINFVLGGVNKAIAAINKVISAANKVPGVGKFISTVKPIDTVSLGRLDTNTIATNSLIDTAARGAASGAVVAMTGNVFLSEDVAEKIGDLILGKLKLSSAL